MPENIDWETIGNESTQSQIPKKTEQQNPYLFNAVNTDIIKGKDKKSEILISRVEDLERKIARLMANQTVETFPWDTLDSLLDNLMARDQFKMKPNGACNNITIWRMLLRLKDARLLMEARKDD